MDVRKLDQGEIESKIHEINSGVSLGWEIEDEKLTKTFKFKDFQQAFGFMTMCAIYAEKQNHHPEWFNVYSTVKVQLTTHDVSGISYKDFDLASKMEQISLGLI